MRRLLFFFLFLLSMHGDLFAVIDVDDSKVTIRVIIENIKNSKGDILLGLYDTPTGTFEIYERYIGDYKKASLANNGTLTFEFNVPKGNYVFVSMHDENSNQYLDKNWLGLPSESYAISNGVRIPNWNKSLVTVDKDMEVKMKLK